MTSGHVAFEFHYAGGAVEMYLYGNDGDYVVLSDNVEQEAQAIDILHEMAPACKRETDAIQNAVVDCYRLTF